MAHRWTFPKPCLLALPLILLGACGGGSSSSPPPMATRILYTPPTTGSYQLTLNTSKTTDKHLVLDLLGPAGTSGRGVAFHLTTEPGQLSWSKVEPLDSEYAQSVAFGRSFGSFVKTKASSGGLQVGAFLMNRSDPSVTFDPTQVLATVALDIAPGAIAGVATLRPNNNKAVILPATPGSDPVAITITTGTVTLQ